MGSSTETKHRHEKHHKKHKKHKKHHHDHHHAGAAEATHAASTYTAPAPTTIAAPAVTYATPAATASTYTAPAPTMIAVPAVSYTAPPDAATYATQYVTFQGMQLPHFHDTHLRTLHPTKLRDHANLLYSTIGHSTLGKAVPVHDHELLEWIIFVQNAHLAPLLLVVEVPA